MTVRPYAVSWLADLLHSFPHIDLTFHAVDPRFNPDSPRYRESLLFWGAIPVLWLLVTLLVFLMYFCYRCCQKDMEKKKAGGCLPWTMAILAILACGVTGVGFYGNEEAHNGLKQFAGAGQDMKNTITEMEHQVVQLQELINNTVEQQLREMRRLYGRHVRINETAKRQLQRMADETVVSAEAVLASVEDIRKQAHRSHMASHPVVVTEEYGYYRWLGTIMLLVWQILLFLLLLAGIGKTSKCTLLMFCAFGIFTLVLAWVSAGLHLGVSVGLGDLCVDPDPYFEDMSKDMMKSMDRSVVHYYIKCTPNTPNPFSNNLQRALEHVHHANNSLYQAVNMTERMPSKPDIRPFVQQVGNGLNRSVLHIQQLTALVECRNLHKDYSNAVKAVCYHALPGIAFLLVCATVVGLLLTALVLLASCAWRMFGRASVEHHRKDTTEVKGYHEIDEDEPFFPRAADSTSPTYYSFPRGRHSNPRQHVPMHRRSSPPPAFAAPSAPPIPRVPAVTSPEPPAYSTNEFYRHHNDHLDGGHREDHLRRHAESIA